MSSIPLRPPLCATTGYEGTRPTALTASSSLTPYAGWEDKEPKEEVSKQAEELRHLTRLRAAIVKDRSRLILRATSFWDRFFPELLSLFSKTLSPSCLALLSAAPTPDKILALGEEKLTALLRKASRGKLGQERAREILQAAASSIGVPSPALEETLALLLEQISLLNHQLKALDRRIANLYAQANLSFTSLPLAVD